MSWQPGWNVWECKENETFFVERERERERKGEKDSQFEVSFSFQQKCRKRPKIWKIQSLCKKSDEFLKT